MHWYKYTQAVYVMWTFWFHFLCCLVRMQPGRNFFFHLFPAIVSVVILIQSILSSIDQSSSNFMASLLPFMTKNGREFDMLCRWCYVASNRSLFCCMCPHISSQSLLFTSQFTGNLSEWSSYNSRFHQKFDWIERISDRKLSQMNRCWTEATTITSSFIHKDTTKKLRSNTHTNTPCEWNGHVST